MSGTNPARVRLLQKTMIIIKVEQGQTFAINHRDSKQAMTAGRALD